MTKTDTRKIYRFLVQPRGGDDPRSRGFLVDAHALGIQSLTKLECLDLYFLLGELSGEDLDKISLLLHDPVSQTIDWSNQESENSIPSEQLVEVVLRPGVTDPVSEQILRGAAMLGIKGLLAASSGLRFRLSGDLSAEDIENLALKLFSNPVIQRYAVGEIEDVFPAAGPNGSKVEILPVRKMSEQGLMTPSQDRRAALNLDEMLAIQAYCRNEGRDLTDVEFEMIAQTWSEHCVHKTFKARVNVTENGCTTEIKNLFKETIRAATQEINAEWVHSAFVDNAGLIEFDDTHDLAFKVETHNHPSAIEPFGGANTGVGGVIRDVLGVSAKPVACTDVLCFGPQDTPFDNLPAGVLHPRRIFSGVVAGVQDYGNKIGIPTVSGAIWYDPGYTANPLVYCGCAGLVRRGSHPREALPADHVIVLGGRTGRDGLRGATFSSMAMDAQTGVVAGASVQIGAPVVEKGLIDVIMLACDEGLYHAITDCGAGGLSSAVGEMASTQGADVQMDHVPLKYSGLAPWEIWLSEAQERMVLAVPVENLPRLQEICRRYDVELTDIGFFTSTHRLVVRYDDQIVVDLDNHFLHEGLPQRRLSARVLSPQFPAGQIGADCPGHVSYENLLLRLLAHPNIASKSDVIRVYDHEVQGGTIVKPLTGVMNEGPSDAVVIKPGSLPGTQAFAISAGFNPEYGKLDAYQMAVNVIDEAVRNALAAGANPQRIAILDNFCWGDPNNEETLGGLVQAARGCHDAAVYFGTPFISGKDSLNNEYFGTDGKRHAIPPSLLISGIGILEHWNQAVSMDLKQPGSLIYITGSMQPVFGGSHFNLVCDKQDRQPNDGVPALHPNTKTGYLALHNAMLEGLVLACHDLSEGGLSVAAAEMCIGGGLGLDLTLNCTDPLRWLFGETTGCLLVEVTPSSQAEFEKCMGGENILLLGKVTNEQKLVIHDDQKTWIDLTIHTLAKAWNAPDHTITNNPNGAAL
ncbi:MAG: phosphoribosylformylglycinamidine synthase subunit PurL [Chloroflexi bacterium]|nr:phosphoribosylformylglycinamidine synthase subunit PurL [Chloroflexota bacterium]